MGIRLRFSSILKWAGLAILLAPALAFTQSALEGSEEEPFLRLDSVPEFESTTSEPILLRYRLKTGQVVKMTMDVNVEMLIRQGATRMNMDQEMKIAAKAVVTAVDESGNISALVKITRFQMRVAGPNPVDFDSDKPEEMNPLFKPLTAMINVGIPCRISPVGEMLETDLEPLRLAFRRAGNAALSKVFEEGLDKMVEGTFVQLSVDPVKAGDTYEAGTIVTDQAKVKMSYRIRSVSGDKRMAVLDPIGVIEVNPAAFQGADVSFRKKEMAGWILFDLVKGYASKAEVRMLMLMDIRAGGQEATADVKVISTMSSQLIE